MLDPIVERFLQRDLKNGKITREQYVEMAIRRDRSLSPDPARFRAKLRDEAAQTRRESAPRDPHYAGDTPPHLRPNPSGSSMPSRFNPYPNNGSMPERFQPNPRGSSMPRRLQGDPSGSIMPSRFRGR